MRAFLISLVLLATQARAATLPIISTPCPGQGPGSSWSASFSNSKAIQGFTEDLGIGVMQVVMYGPTPNSILTHTYKGVPQALAQQFQLASNPDQFYAQRIQNAYSELLTQPGNYCILQNVDQTLFIISRTLPKCPNTFCHS